MHTCAWQERTLSSGAGTEQLLPPCTSTASQVGDSDTVHLRGAVHGIAVVDPVVTGGCVHTLLGISASSVSPAATQDISAASLTYIGGTTVLNFTRPLNSATGQVNNRDGCFLCINWRVKSIMFWLNACPRRHGLCCRPFR